MPVTLCFVYMVPYQTVNANSPCQYPEQGADTALGAVLGLLHTHPCPVPEHCHWGVTWGAFGSFHRASVWTGLDSSAGAHPGAIPGESGFLHLASTSQICAVSGGWGRKGSTEPQEGQAATGRHCHREGTVTGRALPQEGHCRGSAGPHSLCSEPPLAVQIPLPVQHSLSR